MRRAAHALRTLAVLGVLMAILMPSTMSRAGTQAQPLAAESLPGPIGHHGRWVTDADGRVLLLHGVNFVAKVDGETPAEMGFGDDDAEFLADNGFDVVRLGLTAGSIMPSPGVIDTAYLASFRQTIDTITDHGLLVLVDLHQDGWGPSLGSDGFPEWMTITHGAENTHTDFPLYYITNPAIQAAFDSFWGNEPGPESIGIQDRVGTMMAALADSVADNPGVLGYDLINEPWPGTVWQDCLTGAQGCPEQDKALDAYNARMAQAIRTQDSTRLLLGEPYVLFNFGLAPTNITLPSNDPASGMSYHLYTTDPALEPAVQDFAVQWADDTCGALMNTEFDGATATAPIDVAAIDRRVNEIDRSLIPWIWWAYNGGIAGDMSQPVGATPINEPVVNTLVRPHPRAVAGTPLASHLRPRDPGAAVHLFDHPRRRRHLARRNRIGIPGGITHLSRGLRGAGARWHDHVGTQCRGAHRGRECRQHGGHGAGVARRPTRTARGRGVDGGRRRPVRDHTRRTHHSRRRHSAGGRAELHGLIAPCSRAISGRRLRSSLFRRGGSR